MDMIRSALGLDGEAAVIAKAKTDAIARSRSEAFAGNGSVAMPPKTGEYVETSFGPGVVDSFRTVDGMYAINLAWRIADDGRTLGYFSPESVFKGEGKARASAAELMGNIMRPGQRVHGPFGGGEVASYDVNVGIYKVVLDWELDGGTHAVVYSPPESVAFEVRAEKGDCVLTPYGTGRVLAVREDGIHVVQLEQVSGGATGYLSAEAIQRKIKTTCGSYVKTVLGNAYVLRYRTEDDIYTIALDYALAYVNEEAILGPLTTAEAANCTLM